MTAARSRLHGPYADRLGCDLCDREPVPGWIETDNNGPIVPCRVCNPITERDLAWDRAERQRDVQRRSAGQRRAAR